MNPREQAKVHLDRAEQLLRVVYPLSNDPKVLVDVCRELAKCFPFLVRIAIQLPKEQQQVIDEVENIMEKHEAAPVEFSKDKKFVICSDQYDLTQVTPESITKYITTLREFVKNE